MNIGRPFGRAPREKSSKLYEDRVVNADKLPVEKPSYGAFGSLAGSASSRVPSTYLWA